MSARTESAVQVLADAGTGVWIFCERRLSRPLDRRRAYQPPRQRRSVVRVHHTRRVRRYVPPLPLTARSRRTPNPLTARRWRRPPMPASAGQPTKQPRPVAAGRGQSELQSKGYPMYLLDHHGPTLVSSDVLQRMAFDRPGLEIDRYGDRMYLTVGQSTFYAILGDAA